MKEWQKLKEATITSVSYAHNGHAVAVGLMNGKVTLLSNPLSQPDHSTPLNPLFLSHNGGLMNGKIDVFSQIYMFISTNSLIDSVIYSTTTS